MLIDQATGRQIIWGFLLENTFFTEFDKSNHAIIEKAYSQRKKKQTSHYIVIQDSHLAFPARIYFGVAQVHLRMPGTRYYVRRNLSKVPPVVMPSPTHSIEHYFPEDFLSLPNDVFPLIQPDDINFPGLSMLPLPSPPLAYNEASFNFLPNYYSQDGVQAAPVYSVNNNNNTNSNDQSTWSALTDPIFWCVTQEIPYSQEDPFFSTA